MANPQAQANGVRKTKAAKASKEKKQRREPSRLTWWWRFFWMRRSGARTVWALILAIPALLMIVYLALSASDQTQVVAAIQAAAQIVGQTLGPTGLRVGMEIAMVVFALASMTLLLAPGYRQYRYLHLPTSVIPRSTVLLDFENMAGNQNGEQLLELMLERLKATILSSHDFSQRRADLLFFMDARQLKDSAASGSWRGEINRGYNILYLNGFQLMNSPHNVTRVAEMSEAVDREIELFAFERALSGGFKQEFVIVSGDGDYAPLIYRLVALGHDVQVWTWGRTAVYDKVKRYIPLTVVHLLPPDEQAHQDSSRSLQDSGAANTSSANTSVLSLTSRAPLGLANMAPMPQEPPHLEFQQPGVEMFYQAIYHTVAKYRSLVTQKASAKALFDKLSSYLDMNQNVSKLLLAVGYAGKGSRGSWIRSITAVGALATLAPDQAASQLFALTLATAHALVSASANREGFFTIPNVLTILNTSEIASPDLRAALDTILANTRYSFMDVRYLAHSARALGIITFASAPATPDLISNPRLTALGEHLIAQFSAGSQPDAPGATE